MAQSYKIISLTLVILIGIFVQVLLGFADSQDSPNKAALEFTSAYFALDKAGMSERICQADQIKDDVDVIDQYVYNAAQEAKMRGFEPGCYIQRKLSHVQTKASFEGQDKAQVHLRAEVKSPLRTFFSKGDVSEIDEILTLTKEDGKWKVCGHSFAL